MGNSEPQMMATAVPNELRRAERRETSSPSTVRTDGMKPIDVTVLDFSTTGFRIDCEDVLAVSSEISIGLPGIGTRRAFIAWRKLSQYGCAFHTPIAQEEADRAFSASADVIALGKQQQAVVTKPEAVAVKLDAEHNHWYLPLDAILAIAGYAGVAAYAIWRFLA
jgi:hypothetical protein